jgi:hypothetical protein
MCLLEAVSFMAGEPFSDRPAGVDRTLAAFGRAWNDGMRTDAERDQLKPYVPVLVGTAGSGEDASRRAWMALDWSVRVSTPAWLDLAGLAGHAEKLRGRPELTGPDDETFEVLKAARREAAAAWDAARAAAGAAARDAAWDAARDAAGAAGDAARDAAGAAARDAGDAARDAAGAAWDAARDVLEAAAGRLQHSAHQLYRRMIAAGPHDAEAFAGLPELTS